MAHTTPADHLPSLAFGRRYSHIDDTAQEMEKRLRSFIPGLQECGSLKTESGFKHRSSHVTLNGLTLLSTASTPVRINYSRATLCSLLVPIVGQTKIIAEGIALHCQPGSMAAFVSNCARTEISEMRSLLMIGIDPNRIESVVNIMLGCSNERQSALDLFTPREISLQIGRVSFEIIFRLINTALDQFLVEPDFLEVSGLDDYIYRNIAMMLHPKIFLSQSVEKIDRFFSRRKLDYVCQYVVSSLSDPISLSSMEEIGQMSKRSLHYAFQSRFGCTPMQWVRQERLTLAHNKLSSTPHGISIAEIALSCGFRRPARFTDYYNHRYGVLPCVTMARTTQK